MGTDAVGQGADGRREDGRRDGIGEKNGLPHFDGEAEEVVGGRVAGDGEPVRIGQADFAIDGVEALGGFGGSDSWGGSF